MMPPPPTKKGSTHKGGSLSMPPPLSVNRDTVEKQLARRRELDQLRRQIDPEAQLVIDENLLRAAGMSGGSLTASSNVSGVMMEEDEDDDDGAVAGDSSKKGLFANVKITDLTESASVVGAAAGMASGETWVPPQDQKGDGRTRLNAKYGY